MAKKETKVDEQEPEQEVYSTRKLQKNKREEIRAYYSFFKGIKLFNLRVFVPSGENEFKPTPKGISINADLAEDLVEILTKSINAERKRVSKKID